MQLLERDGELAQLARVLGEAEGGGPGCCALVSGEAGIGKTALIHAFVGSLPRGTVVLQCGCEALFTPRPLGPLLDLAAQLPPSIEQALHQGLTYTGLFPALLRFFRESARPRVLVVEDVHWADAGTLDLLRYLGRRMRELPLLMLLTHRDEAVDAEHPLGRVLGELPPATTLRLPLQRLSSEGVERLARAARRDGASIWSRSGGNPFCVAELLASPDGAVPPSVRDAVLAELGRVGPAARELAQCVSLCPGRAERSVLSALTTTDDAAVGECLRSGVLVDLGTALAFRHEIARNAVHDALSAHRRLEGHAAIYRALGAAPGAAADIARRVHHAEAAGLAAEVNALAPEAARQAAAAGDHREAARLYGLALRDADRLEPAACAGLLEAQAHECLLINRHRASIWCLERALAIHRSRDDRLRIGVALRDLARLHWFEQGSSPTTDRLAREAIAMLEALPPGRELALAYSTLSHLRLVGEDMQGAQDWGLRAIELAEAVDDPKALCHALNNVGAARLRLQDDAIAFGRLQRSLALALEHGLDQDAARAYNNLFIMRVVHHDFAAGLRHAEEGINFCESRGLDVFNVRIRIRRAFARIVMGQWAEAQADLNHVAQAHLPSPMEAATLAFVAALLGLRRGEDGARQRLAESVAAMERHRVEIWFISTAAVAAEAAWLDGDDAGVATVATPALARLAAIGDRWRCGELAGWLVRSRGRVPEGLPELPLPYRLELEGRLHDAAREWLRLGCPYARALALSGGSEDDLHEAQSLFEQLGAEPAAARVRRLLRERGARSVRRGPQPRTRGDPLGLTARERQVFELARQGLSNAGIAQRLHRSERTVEHHVAAVLHKLGVGSRVQLIARHGGAAN